MDSINPETKNFEVQTHIFHKLDVTELRANLSSNGVKTCLLTGSEQWNYSAPSLPGSIVIPERAMVVRSRTNPRALCLLSASHERNTTLMKRLLAAFVLLLCMNATSQSSISIGVPLITPSECDANAIEGKVTICHRTTSEKNPYVAMSVSTSACSEAHAGHAEDFIAIDGSCGSVAP